MERDLSFIQPGATFPTPEQRRRLNHYRNNRLLFEGAHDYVFHRWAQTRGVEQLSVIVNWHRRLSLLWADMLFGQEPTITAQRGDEELKQVIRENELFRTCYEVALDVSRYGTGVFKIRYSDGMPRIEAVPPDIWFPVVNARNIKEIQYHVIAWKWKDENDNHFLDAEIHSKNEITYRTYALTRDSKVHHIISEETETHNAGFLVVPVHNITTSETIIGHDDYADINPILEDLEIRLTQISRVLDKHADPSMYGDESALQLDEATGDYVVRGGGAFYPVSEDGQPPGYLTWDGSLQDAFKQIDTLMEQFYVITQTSPAAFGQMKSGLAESGSALKRLLMATIIKSNRTKMTFENSLLKVIEKAGVINSMNGGTSFDGIEIEWQDALPEDMQEVVDTEARRFDSGLTSRRSAIRRIDNIHGDQLDQEALEAENDARESGESRTQYYAEV